MVRDCSKHSPRSLGSLKTSSNPQTGAINHWSRKGEWAWRAAGDPSVGFRRASWVCVQDDSPYKWEMLQTCKGEDTKPYKYTFHLSTNTCYAENLAGRGRREATLLKEKRVSRESPKMASRTLSSQSRGSYWLKSMLWLHLSPKRSNRANHSWPFSDFTISRGLDVKDWHLPKQKECVMERETE